MGTSLGADLIWPFDKNVAQRINGLRINIFIRLP